MVEEPFAVKHRLVVVAAVVVVAITERGSIIEFTNSTFAAIMATAVAAEATAAADTTIGSAEVTWQVATTTVVVAALAIAKITAQWPLDCITTAVEVVESKMD